MRIAISVANQNGLDSLVSEHFGRCPCFVLVDVEGQEVTDVSIVDNPYYGNHAPGEVPSFIHSQGATVMLAGGMGQRAVSFFEEHGIQVATGAAGTVRDALQSYLGGGLRGIQPCEESQQHHGCH